MASEIRSEGGDKSLSGYKKLYRKLLKLVFWPIGLRWLWEAGCFACGTWDVWAGTAVKFWGCGIGQVCSKWIETFWQLPLMKTRLAGAYDFLLIKGPCLWLLLWFLQYLFFPLIDRTEVRIRKGVEKLKGVRASGRRGKADRRAAGGKAGESSGRAMSAAISCLMTLGGKVSFVLGKLWRAVRFFLLRCQCPGALRFFPADRNAPFYVRVVGTSPAKAAEYELTEGKEVAVAKEIAGTDEVRLRREDAHLLVYVKGREERCIYADKTWAKVICGAEGSKKILQIRII